MMNENLSCLGFLFAWLCATFMMQSRPLSCHDSVQLSLFYSHSLRDEHFYTIWVFSEELEVGVGSRHERCASSLCLLDTLGTKA